jgi:hypothetical protein
MDEPFYQSWGFVYALVAAPMMLMGVNFIFGRCTMAEAMDHRVEGTEMSIHARRMGKAAFVGVVACFVWQLIVYGVTFRLWSGRPVSDCSFAYTMYWCVDWCSSLLTGTVAPSDAPTLQCTPLDVTHGVGCMSFVYLFVRCLASIPQQKRKSVGCSYCSKCGAWVDGMDHHCYLLHNCVGKVNRFTFVRLVASCSLLAAVEVMECREFALSGSLVAGVSYAAAIVALIGSGGLLGFQLLLLRKGLTTLSFLKLRQRETQHTSLLHFLVSTLLV